MKLEKKNSPNWDISLLNNKYAESNSIKQKHSFKQKTFGGSCSAEVLRHYTGIGKFLVQTPLGTQPGFKC